MNDTWLLNIYNITKFSEPLEGAYQMKFKYRVSELQARYFDISLAAPEGPFRTKNHQFGLEAIPLDKGSTFSFAVFLWLQSLGIFAYETIRRQQGRFQCNRYGQRR